MISLAADTVALKILQDVVLKLALSIEVRLVKEQDRHFFSFEDDELVLHDRNLGNLKFDFVNDRINYKRIASRGKQELIAKAVGMNAGFSSVIDLTAGLGQDAVFLLRTGCTVAMIERNPWIYILLRDALTKAQKSPETAELFSKMSVHFSEGFDFLNRPHLNRECTAILIDPMYPDKKKSALPRKEMQIFRDLIGGDSDGEELVLEALKIGFQRVVVKRPVKAEFLAGKPTHQFVGKTVRFDLYIPRAKVPR